MMTNPLAHPALASKLLDSGPMTPFGKRLAQTLGLCLSLMGCRPANPPPPLSPSLTVRAERSWPTKLPGICDASAAVQVSPGVILVASDERPLLTLHSTTRPEATPVSPPLDELLLAAGIALDTDDGAPRELDIEGGTQLQTPQGVIALWVGSHGRRKLKWKGDKNHDPPRWRLSSPSRRENREWLFATTIPSPAEPTIRLVGKPVRLSDALRSSSHLPSSIGIALQGAAAKAPNAGGWNIEGMTINAEGALLLGMRSPLTADGHAIVLRLDRALDVLQGQVQPRFADATALDLGHRGIRSIEWSPTHGSFVVIAGPPSTLLVDGLPKSVPLSQAPERPDHLLRDDPSLARDFALYSWPSWTKPVSLAQRLPAHLRPEIVVPQDGSWLLVSDNGKTARTDDGDTCGDLLRAQPGGAPAHEGIYVDTLTITAQRPTKPGVDATP